MSLDITNYCLQPITPIFWNVCLQNSLKDSQNSCKEINLCSSPGSYFQRIGKHYKIETTYIEEIATRILKEQDPAFIAFLKKETLLKDTFFHSLFREKTALGQVLYELEVSQESPYRKVLPKAIILEAEKEAESLIKNMDKLEQLPTSLDGAALSTVSIAHSLYSLKKEIASLSKKTEASLEAIHRILKEKELNSFSGAGLGEELLDAIDQDQIEKIKSIFLCSRFRDIPLHVLGEALKKSVFKENLQIMKAIVGCNRFNKIPIQMVGTTSSFEGIFDVIATNDNLEAFKILLNSSCLKEPSPQLLANIFVAAAQKGSLKIVQEFLKNPLFEKIPVREGLGLALIHAASGGHLQVMQEIEKSKRYHEILTRDLERARNEAARKSKASEIAASRASAPVRASELLR